MKVLVVDHASTAGSTAKLLEDMEVVTAGFRDAGAVAARGRFDVVLATWPAHVAKPEEFVTMLRAAQTEYTAIVLIASGTDQQQAGAAFHAGADDCVRLTATREELVARIRRAGRIARLERLFGRVPSIPARVSHRIERLGAWTTYPELNAETLSALCGHELLVVTTPSSFSPTFAAEVRLAAPGDRLEIPVIIEGEAATLEALGRTMLGEEVTTAAQIDMLLEIANTVAGCFARRALDDQKELTMGLPFALSVEQATGHMEVTEARQSVCLATADGAIRLRIQIGIRTRANVYIPVTKLREGMVIARDLRTSRGILLAKAGTRVSATQAERMVALLGATEVLEVADAAA